MKMKEIQKKLEDGEYSSIDQLLKDCKSVDLDKEKVTLCHLQSLAGSFSSYSKKEKQKK